MTSWVKGPDASLSATAGDAPFNATHTTEAELRRVELDRHDDRWRSSSTVIACPIAQLWWIALQQVAEDLILRVRVRGV